MGTICRTSDKNVLIDFIFTIVLTGASGITKYYETQEKLHSGIMYM